MRTRYKSMRDYGLTSKEEEQVKELCFHLSEEDARILYDAASSAAPGLEEYIVKSLTSPSRAGYRRIGNIPVKEEDFYSYKRKTLALFYDRLRLFGRWKY